MQHNKKIISALAMVILSACSPEMKRQWSALTDTKAPMCSPQMLQNAQFVMANMSRIQIGMDKSMVMSTVGYPQRMESFMLTDRSMVEVLFYQTSVPACTGAMRDGITPFVVQNGRLIGYGTAYYQNFILPSLAHKVSTPQGENQPRAVVQPYGQPAYGGVELTRPQQPYQQPMMQQPSALPTGQFGWQAPQPVQQPSAYQNNRHMPYNYSGPRRAPAYKSKGFLKGMTAPSMLSE